MCVFDYPWGRRSYTSGGLATGQAQVLSVGKLWRVKVLSVDCHILQAIFMADRPLRGGGNVE